LTPYIQLVDLNNDGIKDLIKAYPFGGSYSSSYFPQNWILFGKEDLKFDYFNYPILTPLTEINIPFIDLTELEINWTTTHLTNVMNPFDQEMDMFNLRGEVTDWIVYYDQTPWGDKNSDGVNRITFPHDGITKVSLGNNKYAYELKLTPEFEGNNDIFLRISYMDSNGVENPLSSQIQFSVNDFDYDEDGVPNVTDTCPETASGETVDANGCSDSQLNVENEILDNSLKLYPNPTDNTLFIKGNKNLMNVSVYNMLGKEVLSKMNTNNIDVKVLPKGIYIIKISDDVGQIYRKFIKN